jgi:hypothetical protein
VRRAALLAVEPKSQRTLELMTRINRAGHAHFRELPEEFVRNVTHFVTSWD